MKVLNSKVDRDEWLALLGEWPEREVFAHPDYIDLYTDQGSEALCAVMQTGDATVLYPFIKRSLQAEPYCTECLYDIVTAYGYGGIYAYGQWTGESIREFCREFAVWAEGQGVVSEFIRFSLDSASREFYTGGAELNNHNVVVDLTQSAEQMWSGFKHKVRKNVNRARSHGIEIVFDDKGERLDDFLGIYFDTMDRRNAGKGYYFAREYFESIIRNLGNQFVFCHALLGDKVISTELVLVSQNNIYSFLGGTLDEYFEMRPNDLLKYEMINWGHGMGKKKFVLGGGYVPMDGIFQYKLAFAPDGVVPFYVGKQIFIPKKYTELIGNRRNLDHTWNPDENFFPLYRA